MTFYTEVLTKQADGISYFHVDITEEMRQLYGKEIIRKALIISNEYQLIDSIKEFFKKCECFWRDSKIIYRGNNNILITLSNGKQMYINNKENYVGKFN